MAAGRACRKEQQLRRRGSLRAALVWLRRVMQLLDRVGDRAAAAGVYREFSTNLEKAFELEPSPETQQLLAQIRARSAEPVEIARQPAVAPPRAAVPAPVQTEPARRRKSPFVLSAAVVALIALAALM